MLNRMPANPFAGGALSTDDLALDNPMVSRGVPTQIGPNNPYNLQANGDDTYALRAIAMRDPSADDLPVLHELDAVLAAQVNAKHACRCRSF